MNIFEVLANASRRLKNASMREEARELERQFFEKSNDFQDYNEAVDFINDYLDSKGVMV